MKEFTHVDWRLIDEIVGGRYDMLKEMVEDPKVTVDKSDMRHDVDALWPTVEKIRRQLAI